MARLFHVTLAAALVERVGELWNMYDQTKTTIWSTVNRVFDVAGQNWSGIRSETPAFMCWMGQAICADRHGRRAHGAEEGAL